MSDTTRELARELGCFTEADVAALAGVETSTVRNWRSRRFGPPFTTLGNATLYPIESAREWITQNVEMTQSQASVLDTSPRRRRRAKGATQTI